MPVPATDRNLLFGVLALQMDFVSRDALIRAMNAWVLDKARPLGNILAEQGALREDAHHLLEALVQKHLEMHGGDPQKSLASVSSLGPAREELQLIADPDLHASLAHVPATRPPGQDTAASRGNNGPAVTDQKAEADPFATREPTVGTPTSSGIRFRILRPHARGGLGQVFVARDEELGREVALKEIQGCYADHSESRSRFLLEAEITGGLEHPGIVPVYGLGTYPDGRPYYAMRFIRGDSLQEAIRRFHEAEKPGRDPGQRALELRQLLGRFVDVCNAVAYAHSRGVLHRDLKPGNVMLGQYGETLVVDWGLAKPGSQSEDTGGPGEGLLWPASGSGSAATQMGSALGTPSFMSPEQAVGQLDRLGPASDVYGLGATLYALLTGKAPFEGDDIGAVLQAVQRGDFRPPRQAKAGVPTALEAVCLKAMALRPEDRYPWAKALADEVEHWLADEPVAAYREPWRLRAGRWVRRHRTAAAVAVAAAAATTVCLGVATVLLTAANQRERTAREEVQKQQERADGNLARARKAVEDYCTNVADDVRLQQADLHALRKKLLETAVPFYVEVAQQRVDDPELQADRGRAYVRLAWLRKEIGETVAGIEDCRKGQAIFTDLVRVHPDIPDYRDGLADSHNSLGSLLRDRAQPKEAAAEHRRALAIYEKLATEFPAAPGYRKGVSDNHQNLGVALHGLGQSREAAAEHRQAIAINAKLAQDFPARPLYRQSLALSHNNLGTQLSALRQSREAAAEYRKALAIKEKLAKDFPAVPAYRKSIANSHHLLGILLRNLGQSKEAEVEYRKALAIRRQLAQDFPVVPDSRRDMAYSHHYLANLLSDRGQHEEATAEHRQALAIREKLVHDFPTFPGYRDDLAESHIRLGILWEDSRRTEAEAAYRQALAIYETLTRDFPTNPYYREQLAWSHNNVSYMLYQKRHFKEAEAAYRRALAINEKLVKDFPSSRGYAYQLGFICVNMGNLVRDEGRPAAALEWYGRTRTTLQATFGKRPETVDARRSLRDAHADQARALMKLARDADAVKDWDRAIELDEGSDRPRFRLWRDLALARTGKGDYSKVVADAIALSQAKGAKGKAVYDAARVCALASASVNGDAKLADQYAARAIELLGKAHKAGYFKEAIDVERMKREGDLDSLRSRDAYKKLLAELEARTTGKRQ